MCQYRRGNEISHTAKAKTRRLKLLLLSSIGLVTVLPYIPQSALAVDTADSRCPTSKTTFVLAETTRFLISICGKTSPTSYVAVAKNGNSSITLPLSSHSSQVFTAKNDQYTYTLDLRQEKLIVGLPGGNQSRDALLSTRTFGVSNKSQPFSAVLPYLKTQTQVPVLLPTIIPDSPFGGQTIYAIANISAHSYEASLAYDANCNGANVCNHFAITGTDSTGIAKEVQEARQYGDTEMTAEKWLHEQYCTGESVTLAKGIAGRFKANLSGASAGGNEYLSWEQNGIFYQIRTRAYPILPKSELIKSANSAIMQGILK